MSELFKAFARGKRLTAKELEVLASQKVEEAPVEVEVVTEEVPAEEASTEEVSEEVPAKPIEEEVTQAPETILDQPVLLEKPVVEETKETFATLTSRRNKSKRYGLVQD